MKTQPLLESALESLETALHARDKQTARWNIEDAMQDIKEAIAQIQGAREDAARMAGRVTLDTELLDMLAPKEAN
jgi:hypothetical protein